MPRVHARVEDSNLLSAPVTRELAAPNGPFSVQQFPMLSPLSLMIRNSLRRVGLLQLIGCTSLVLVLVVDVRAQACDRFLNASDGDDGSAGTSAAEAVRSFEHAFLTFPSGSVVCMAAGEYFHTRDSDGVQLSDESASDKSMTFVLERFGDSNTVAFTEDEFRMDVGDGSVRFVRGSASRLRLGIGFVNNPQSFPGNTNLLHTVALVSGTLDARLVDLVFTPGLGTAPAVTAGARSTITSGSQSIRSTLAQDEIEFVRVLPGGVLRVDSLHVAASVGTSIASMVVTSSGRIEAGAVTSSAMDLLIMNEGDGTLELGVAGRLTRFAAGIVNTDQATVRIVAASEVTGSIENAGSLFVNAPLTIKGSLVNAGTVVLGAALALAGPLENSGRLELGAYNLSVSGAPSHSNTGSVTASASGIGWLELYGDTELIGTGEVANVRGRDGTQSVSAVQIAGDVEAGPGTILSVAAESILGSATADGGELILPATTIGGDLVAGAGVVRLSGSVKITGSLLQTAQSTIETADRRIELRGDFRREGGTFLGERVGLVFVGDDERVFEPGSGLSLDTLEIRSGRVHLSGDSLHVVRSLSVGNDAVLLLDHTALRMSETGGQVHVDGQVESRGSGVLAFRRSAQQMSGRGYIDHVRVDLPDENAAVAVYGMAEIRARALSLSRGTLQVAPGSSFTLEGAGATALISRNLGDANGDGSPDGKPVVANETGLGTFHLPPSGFDLEYVASAGIRVDAGVETESGQLIDFRIAMSGPDTGRAVVALSSDLQFSGDLDVGPNAALDVGPFTLEATGAGAVHSVRGTVRADTGRFVVSGAASINGDPDVGPSAIQNLSARSDGRIEILGLAHVTGALRVERGEIHLVLDVGDEPGADSLGSVRSLLLSEPGRVVLGSHVRIVDELSLAGGDFRTGDYDAIMADGASFSATTGSSMQEAGDGRLLFSGSGSLQSADSHIPRLVIDAGSEGVVRLSGDAGVSQAFVHASGTLDLQEFRFVNEGRLWSVTDGAYGGSGIVVVRGNVAGSFERSVQVPNFTLSGLTDQTIFTLSSKSDATHALSVENEMRLTRGTIDLGVKDVVVAGTFITDGGEMRATTGTDVADGDNGELVLRGADVSLASEQTLPNVRVRGDSRILPESGRLVVGGQIVFEEGSLLGSDSSKVRLATGSRTVRMGTGSFGDVPSFAPDIDLYYDLEHAAVERLVSARELPSSELRNLFIAAGEATLELATRVLVKSVLELRSGTVIPHAPVEIAGGGTVHFRYVGGSRPAFEEASYVVRGPITLLFTGLTGVLRSSDLSFPPEASVRELVIRMGSRQSEQDHHFFLHADRRVDRLVVENATPSSRLHLESRKLTVSERAELRSGAIYGADDSVLEVNGDLSTLPGTRIDGPLTAIVHGGTEIGGAFGASLLRSAGNVTVSGRLGGPNVALDAGAESPRPGVPSVELIGRHQIVRMTNQDENSSTVDDTVHRLTIRLADSTGWVSYESDGNTPHTLGVDHLVLEKGPIHTGRNDLRLPNDGPGFVRAGGAVSHVVGHVSRRILTGQPNPFTLPFGEFEFPVGGGWNGRAYRPLTIRLTEENPFSTTSVLRVGHDDAPAGGYLGLPIAAGDGVRIEDTAEFHWTIDASPPLRAGQRLNLTVTGTGLDASADVHRLRILRRSPGIPSKEAWQTFGPGDQHESEIVNVNGMPAPVVRSNEGAGGAGGGRHLIAIGVDAENMTFSRLQVVNLFHDDLGVLVDDSLRASGLSYGDATPYLRVDPYRGEIRILKGASVLVRDSLDLEPGQDYLLVAAGSTGLTTPRLYLTDAARAVPDIEEKSSTSLAFYNASSAAPPLALSMDGAPETLFSHLASGEFSREYLPVAPADVEFALLTATDHRELLSARAELAAAAGMTVAAVAADMPGKRTASEHVQLIFVTNHGDRVSTLVQVPAEEPVELPESFSVAGNFPNPFNPSTTIVVHLPDAADVTVEVYDLLGRRMMSAGPAPMSAGRNRHIEIDGGDLASGVYLYRVVAESSASTRRGTGKMTVLK